MNELIQKAQVLTGVSTLIEWRLHNRPLIERHCCQIANFSRQKSFNPQVLLVDMTAINVWIKSFQMTWPRKKVRRSNK